MNSMTGFGRAARPLGDNQLTIELNAVNRRFLELSISLPKEWQSLERSMMEILRASLGRGKIHASVQLDSHAVENSLDWDRAALENSLAGLRQLADQNAVPFELNLDILLKLVLQHRGTSRLPDPAEAQPLLEEALREALASLLHMRRSEGEALCQDMEERIAFLHATRSAILQQSAQTVPNYREHLMSRLRTANLEIDLNDERVLKEVAIFADRCDITEELTRLESHLNQFAQTLRSGENSENATPPSDNPSNAGVGRKLEFILQEINREVNTIGAKSNRIEINKLVIEAKNEIERLREQVQNVE